MATFDHEVTLITKTFEDDDIGNQIPAEKKITILCDEKSIGRNEFYNAAAAGLKPSITLVIHAYEYEGQQTVEFKGVRYKVMRTYQVDFEELELTCERVIGNG